MMKTGAIILASWQPLEKNRDNEDMPIFLSMYPLDGTTVIKREIAALRKASVSPILVLAGCKKEILKNHLSHNHVVFIEDDACQEPDRERTLQAGLAAARSQMDRVIVVPVDMPAFSFQTLEKLLTYQKSTIPIYDRQAGWPRTYVFSDKGTETTKAEQVPVDDPGVLLSLLDPDGIEKTQQYLKTQRSINGLRCKTKVILTREEDFFGPGVCRLLEYIDETGSIQAAASRMHMSYSKSWKMINKVEQEMGFPFLNRSNGGRSGGSSTLTEEGRLFIERYQAMSQDMRRISQNFFDVYFKDFQI